MKEWTINGINILKCREDAKAPIPALFGEEGAKAARAFHEQINEYSETPLVSLPHLAEQWGVAGIYVKDESKRFSLNAFKGLGGSYAMFRILCDKLGLDPTQTTLADLTGQTYRDQISQIEFVTCTDGNHGRGVSWAAGIFGCKAHVYMPYGSQEVRAEAILLFQLDVTMLQTNLVTKLYRYNPCLVAKRLVPTFFPQGIMVWQG